MDRSLRPAAEVFEGKTYSLRPLTPDSNAYFSLASEVTNGLLRAEPDATRLLETIRWLSRSKRNLRYLSHAGSTSRDGRLLKTLRERLSPYTTGVERHLKGLSTFERWDRSLAASEEQYHLFMIEIELTNRLNARLFRSATKTMAFLPHCLRDIDADCRAAERDIDYVCKGCTDGCRVNIVSKMLRLHGVKPFIWMTADLRSVFRKGRTSGESLGVLGIACIPELVHGMRLCQRHDIPVVGIPLDANRCARWWGELYPNTVNLEKLESLLPEPKSRNRGRQGS
jgi:hypothetical protein